MKALPNSHQGIEYIQIAQLPPEQAGRLSAWLPENLRFTVVLEDVALHDCISYSTYEAWYEQIHFEAHFRVQWM